jgi:hypothetical protein
MVEKGRHAKGERNSQSKLTEDGVQEIRRLGGGGNRRKGQFSQLEIARRFGVQEKQISRIVNYKSWKHVP